MLSQRSAGRTRRHYLGYLALAFIIAPTVLAFAALTGFARQGPDWALLGDPYLLGVLGFSLKQAALSALLSVLLALPVARALYYVPQLWGQRLFLSFCLLCFVLPTLVLITGLVALLGRSGWLTPLLGEDWNLYGLHGILLAHVFLNMPFAVRALLQQLHSIPDTSWRLAAQLKLSGWQRWRYVEWPVLQGHLPLLSGFIFVLCFNSFAVVLALGGGPQATTLEVAIYQALKYDFNIGEALLLAWVQFAIAGGLFLLMVRLGAVQWLSIDTASGYYRPRPMGWRRAVHGLVYGLSVLLLALPLLALLPGLFKLEASIWQRMQLLAPLLTTLTLGLACAVLGLVFAYCLLLPLRYARWQQQLRRQWLLEWLATHALVAPAMVLSVGLYILVLLTLPGKADELSWSVSLVLLLNVVVIIPFALQQVRPRLLQFDDQYERLCGVLKLSLWQRLRVEWPWWRHSAISAFCLLLVLAMGDVTVFSIFGTQDWMTLPWLIYSYAGTYRMAEASLTAVVLLLLCALIVFLFERGRRA